MSAASRGERAEAVDVVFRALANPCRRQMLDLLRRRPHTTGELIATFARPGLSRFAVRQHLQVLETAHLVFSVRRGRTRYHHLDPTPLQRVAAPWLGRFRAPVGRALRMLKRMAISKAALDGDSLDP